MNSKEKKPFIPRDKPKSWVLAILSVLIGILVAGPIMFLGVYFESGTIKGLGITVFMGCWFTFAVSWVIFVIGTLKSKYKNIQKQEWSKQLW